MDVLARAAVLNPSIRTRAISCNPRNLHRNSAFGLVHLGRPTVSIYIIAVECDDDKPKVLCGLGGVECQTDLR